MVNEIDLIQSQDFTEERLYSVFLKWYLTNEQAFLNEDIFDLTKDFRSLESNESYLSVNRLQEQAFEALVFDITQDNIQIDVVSDREYYEKIEETSMYFKTHPSIFISIIKNKFLKYIAFNRFLAFIQEEGGVRVINEPFQPIW